MNVMVISVPHTGTTFTEELLRSNLRLHPTDCMERGENLIHREHTYNPDKVKLALNLLRDQPMPLVVPMRHPYLAEEAWKRRKYEVDRMVFAYRALCEHFLPKDPVIMAVDSPKREECLQALSEALGADLKTDWAPVRSVGKTYDMKWQDLTPSDEVKRLADDMQPFLERFYDLA